MKVMETASDIGLKEILFATDFSPVSDTALLYAENIAGKYGSEITAAHVVEPAATVMVPPEGWGACQQAIDNAAEWRMERLSERLQGFPHHAAIWHGDIWEVISGIVAEKKIDLLVMGTHGRSGVGRLLMGSVAEQIFRRASCPVLTVGPGVCVKSPSQADFRQIVFATDFSKDSLAAVRYAVALARDYRAQLALIHVVTQPLGPLTDSEQIVFNGVRDLSALVGPADELRFAPEYVVNFGNPSECILQAARARSADLIVLGVRAAQRSIGTATHVSAATAHNVVSAAVCPVLTVRG